MEASLLLYAPNQHLPIPFSSKPSNPVQVAVPPPAKPTNTFFHKSPSAAAAAAAAAQQGAIDLKLKCLCRHGNLQEAISILEHASTIEVSTYISLLQSCIDSDSIALGRRLHSVLKLVKSSNAFVETKLVSMYAKCGSLEEARRVFDGMRDRNIFSWSAMIGGCSREKLWEEVVELFGRMMVEGVTPDEFLLPKILQACSNIEDLLTGRILHSLAIRLGYLISPASNHVNNSILAMYAKCRELRSARSFFEEMNGKDLVSWNSMILGHCQHGDNEKAYRLFERMPLEGIVPGIVTWNTLITCHNELGNCDRAMEMMKKMEQSGIAPDVFTWTSMLSGLAHNNRTLQALDLFREMQLAGVQGNGMTFAGALSACASLKCLEKGTQVHSLAIKLGYANTVLVANSLIDMYTKCGKLDYGEEVFQRILDKDVFTWNSMISGYVQTGYCGKAYDLFSKMEGLGVPRNVVTWNIMVSGYMHNGDEDQGMELFHKMETCGVSRNVASWNLLIAGSLHNGSKNKALGIFRQMQAVCVKPNSVTILSVLPACANLISAQKVKEIHACVIRSGLQSELSILNSFINTYSKSGDMISAQLLFDSISYRDTITWNSLIAGYVLHRCPEIALDLFNWMKQDGAKPNQATLASIIRAYGLLKMVKEGKELFSIMNERYQISASSEHYAAMVDLFGHSGKLEEASEFIETMVIEPDSDVWAALFTASRLHGNRKMAKIAVGHLTEIEHKNAVYQRLLLQIQDLCNECNSGSKSKNLNMVYEIDDNLGCCWIGHSDRVLTFSTGDRSVPDLKSVYAKLESIDKEIEVAKHNSQKKYLSVEEEVSEKAAGIHCEKLAIVFSLINPPRWRTIRIIKNQRMCFACHTAASYISFAYRQEILLKDPKNLHHFKDGQCSCREYW